MNIAVELPSGKIFNLARFVALFPNSNDIDSGYQLILAGYPHPINLESSDAQTLKEILKLDQNTGISTNKSGWNREEQLQKNQRAMQILAKQIQQYQNISDEESREREELFESFKKTIDAERPDGQKLYSES